MNTTMEMDTATTLAMDMKTMLPMDTDTTLGTSNTSYPLVCWEDWQKESEDKWTPVLFAGVMSSIVLAANLAVIVTIFTTDRLRSR